MWMMERKRRCMYCSSVTAKGYGRVRVGRGRSGMRGRTFRPWWSEIRDAQLFGRHRFWPSLRVKHRYEAV